MRGFIKDPQWRTVSHHDIYRGMGRYRVLGVRLAGHLRCRIEAVDMARVGEGPVEELGLPWGRIDLAMTVSLLIQIDAISFASINNL